MTDDVHAELLQQFKDFIGLPAYPVKPQHMVGLRSIISTLYPNMNPHERAQLIGRSSQKLGRFFDKAFENAGVPLDTTEVTKMIKPLQDLISTKAYQNGAVLLDYQRARN